MIPSRGCIYGISQLTSVAELTERRSIGDWVSAARRHGGYLAAANDLDVQAEFLLDRALVTLGEATMVSPRLKAINALPRKKSEYELARLILVCDPPQWLNVAVDGRRVERAYIPEYDLDYLSWIEPHLDELLCDVYRQLEPDKSTVAEELGRAAELVVINALEHAGLQPIHVALISDSYGYDIEIIGKPVDRIEVKAAGPGTAGSFHLSRNEYEKCLQHGSQWRLVQVIFSNAAFVASRLDLSHIKEIYEISAADVSDIVPLDSPGFKWEESALLTPARESWHIWNCRPGPDFSTEGFSKVPGSNIQRSPSVAGSDANR